MDKLVLNIPKLQETLEQSKKMLTETKETGKAAVQANKKLAAPGTWQGDAANAYKGKAGQFSKNFKTHENTVSGMRVAMRTMLSQAESLNRQALGFAMSLGSAMCGGTKNILTYDPDAKTLAINACDRVISQIDVQLGQAKKAENTLAGIPGFRVSSELSTYRRTLNERKNKLNKLRQAITKYSENAELFARTAIREFGGIARPEGAIATLKSWGITQEEICSMLKGLNIDCCAYAGDPVNMATGNFVYKKEYLKARGLFPLSFRMFYNAQEKRTGTMGSGWTHNFGVCLKKGSQAVTIILEDGHEETFYKNSNDTFTQNFNKHEKLQKTAGGFVYQNAGNLSYIFDEDGRNIRIADLSGNRASLTYVQNRLSRVENNTGGCLDYLYCADGNLIKVSDQTGREVQLSYEDGKVCAVSGEEGQQQQYRYNEKGKLCEITNPLGIRVLANEFDTENRIIKQSVPDGGVIAFAYRDEEKELQITEQNGNEAVYVHDDRMRTTAIVHADGEERYAYNEQNQRTMQIDKNGNETLYGYDDQGNLSQITNALGETLTAEYNKHNKPVKITLCGIERMTGEYDDKGNLLSVRDALGRGHVLTYNENGCPVSLMLPDGSAILLAYDERGNIVSVTDADASETKYEYDRNNCVTAVVDPNGNRTCFSYNRRNDLVRVVNADGKKRAYEYNKAGKLTRITDFNGGVSQYEYNAMSKPTRIVDPGGQETRFEYDLMSNVIKQTNASGAQTHFEYDKLRRLVKMTNSLGHSIMYKYDPNGNRICLTDPQGGQTRLAYDALNRMTEAIGADGARTAVTYDEMGQITSMCDAMGNIRTFAYDAAGQKTEETDQLGNKTAYTYTPLGKISTVTDPEGRVTSYEYEPGGLLSGESHPDGRWISYGYDAAKNLVTKQDQSGYTLNYSYDSLNRIVKISSNHGQEKLYTYDAAGNVTSVTDANGNKTRYAYSPAGKLIQVVDALGNESGYGYDEMGELSSIRQYGAGVEPNIVRQSGSIDEELSEAAALNESNTQMRVTTYQRNILGQIESIEDALGQRETYTYDASGRVICKTDKDGYRTQYAYGLSGQLENIRYADGKTVCMSYDPLRRLTGIQDWLGRTTIETDPTGRAAKVTDHNGKEVQYLYSAGGNRLETVYPDGKKASYHYDEARRLSRLTDGKNTVKYTYDENSRLSEKQLPNGMNTRYEYNDMGMLSRLTHSDREGILDQYTYRYDLMGNTTGINKMRRDMDFDSGQFSYAYDALSRLSEAAKDGNLLRTYEYDAFGNRSRMTTGEGRQTSYTFNALNQLHRVENPYVTRDYRYDARGNANEILENGITKHRYEFGALNRLEKATNADGQTAVYTYNGLGFREGEHIMDAELRPLKQIDYVLDLTKQYHNVLQRTDNGQTKSYIWNNNVVSENGDDGDRFYLHDELGSPIRFSGAGDGAIIDSYAYDEFGGDLTGNQGNIQPFGYTGYRHDNFAEAYFAQAREYDPKTGRFSARDVVKGSIANPFTLNEYAYCWNRPMALVDLNGQWPQWLQNVSEIFSQGVISSANAVTDDALASTVAVTNGYTKVAGSAIDMITSAARAISDVTDAAAETGAKAAVAVWKKASFIGSKIEEDIANFNLDNSDEQTVIDSNFFSAYKGQLVVRINSGRSGSFGLMFLSHNIDTRNDAIATVKHEHGHYVQLQELGVMAFVPGIAIPSIINTPDDYFNQRQEVIADILGGVSKYAWTFTRTESAELEGTAYHDGLLKIRKISDGMLDMAVNLCGSGSLYNKYLAHLIEDALEKELDCVS